MLTVRCSRLPLAVVCPQSVHGSPDEPQPMRGDDSAARLGTAFHDAMARHIEGRDELADVPQDLDVDDLWALTAVGRRLWREQLAALMPSPIVEDTLAAELDGIELTGHPDAYAFVSGVLLDWKTGYLDSDYWDQMRGYALLLGLESVTAIVVNVRRQVIDTRVWTRGELLDWWRGVRERLLLPHYTPGPHCEYCPRRVACSARQQWLGSQIELFRGPVDPGTLTPADAAHAYRIAKAVRDAADAYMEDVKAQVRFAGGRLGPLVLHTTERRSIVASVAWPVLSDLIGESTLQGIAKVGKGDVEREVKRLAQRGKGASMWRDVLKQLHSIGALEISFIERLEIEHGNSDKQTERVGPGDESAAAGETGE